MKGYSVGFGYMGYMPDSHKYELFATEEEYKEAYEKANEPYANIIWLN